MILLIFGSPVAPARGEGAGVGNRSSPAPSVAFYYAADIPDELSVYDIVVVQPEVLAGRDLATHPLGGKLFAYISVGEVEAHRHYARAIPPQWLIGENSDWQSAVVDQSAPGWAAFYVREVVAPLWRQGFRGFFLDTLDSYQLVAKTDAERQRQEKGLVELIRSIKQAYPDARLIFNRGFEILPAVHELAHAVVAESLFQGWNNGKQAFVTVSPSDRQWLLDQFARIRNEYGLPVIVIDYARAGDRARMRQLAHDILSLGLIPWVTTPAIDAVGVGVHEIVPRRVLMLYDLQDAAGDIMASANRFLSTPLNYLGFVPELHDVNEPLPATPAAGRYAGIVLWFSPGNDRHARALHGWLRRQRDDGVPIALMNAPGMPISGGFLDVFDLAPVAAGTSDQHVHVLQQGAQTGFEIAPRLDRAAQIAVRNLRPASIWLELDLGDDRRSEPVAITDWGGYALSPHATVQLPGNLGMRWMIDPFAFLKAALRLEDLPAPDVTTEGGKRLLITHIDGDGFANLAEFPGGRFASEVLLDEVLKRYRIPTTVSVIQGEISPTGAYPQHAARLEPIARRIFALPNVEIASHSFSHPFKWEALEAGQYSEGYNLAIRNYKFDVKAEIDGSVRYIDEHLAPEGKRTKVFLWTGNCNPGAISLARTYALGIGNMNGGDTVMTETNDTLTAVSPIGVMKGGYFQVFAPNQNENVYTNNWLGPYYGYERVIETFKLTESPRRLKPINIYYHTYSASKPAALQALHKVYQYALKQNVRPIYGSEYIRKAQNFNTIVLTREDGGWGIHNATDLVTVRLPIGAGAIDPARSHGLSASHDLRDVRYFTLAGNGSARLVLTSPRAVPGLTARD